MKKKMIITDMEKVQHIDASLIFISDEYEVKKWSFDFMTGKKKTNGYNDCFCFTMVQNGNFLFDVLPKKYDMHTGHIIIEKANFEYGLRPAKGTCTIFNFSESFYRQLVDDYSLHHSFFFSNKNLLSAVLRSTPETDFLHHRIRAIAPYAGKLELDNLVFELVKQVVALLTNNMPDITLNAMLLKYHLNTIEKAKEYMTEYFYKDISLKNIAESAHVSMFHFGRIFKQITQFSPHQYLLSIRLKNAEMLLRSGQQAVKDACYASGFNNVEHFATAFKKRFSVSPVEYRNSTLT